MSDQKKEKVKEPKEQDQRRKIRLSEEESAKDTSMVKGLKAQGVFQKSQEGDELPQKRQSILQNSSLSPAQVECLKDIPIATVRRAWFTMAHLILEPGAVIAVMGCGDGSLPYAMAILNPSFHIISIDSDKKIVTEAKQKWQLNNLEFVVSRISKPSFPNGFLDAVVDSFTLHDNFSDQSPGENQVRDILDNHFALLKKNGILFLREYAHPPPGEYVLMEFPDNPSIGDEPFELSEADLLLRFSEEARASEGESSGFFLEELEPFSEGTRLFRLGFKWAYEFILRKDQRSEWLTEIEKEYTFMTPREFRKTLRAIGARVTYTAPYWDPTTVRDKFEGHFKLYSDEGTPLGHPPTSHIFIGRKVGEGNSLRLEERRPSREPISRLQIKSVRNSVNGQITDLISRNVEIVEFLPYRITDEGRLHIYLHDGLPRAITNAVPRSGKALDGKRWSGHMVESLSVDREILSEYDDFWDIDNTSQFATKHLGLKPEHSSIMEKGPEFYPNPALIDERIESFFVRVKQPGKSITPKWVSQVTKDFSDKGNIREFDAQHILNAISVGFIPNSRLESMILALFSKLGMQAEKWSNIPLHLQETDVPSLSLQELIKLLKNNDKVFEETELTGGNIRTIHSYFVDEGYQNGKVKGLSAHDIEFMITEGETVNTAVVLPLMKDMNGEILAGFIRDYLPVPQRHGHGAKTIRAPSFNLPPDIKDMETAKAFVGQKFGVTADRVMQLGESYFMHNGITPQKIYPFAVLPMVHGDAGPGGTFTEYAPIRWLWALVWFMFEESFATLFKRTMEAMHPDIDFGLDKSVTMNFGQEAKEINASFESLETHMPANFAAPFKISDVAESARGGDDSSSGGDSGGALNNVSEDTPEKQEEQENNKEITSIAADKTPAEDVKKEEEKGNKKNQKKALSKAKKETQTKRKHILPKEQRPAKRQETQNKKDNIAPIAEPDDDIDYDASPEGDYEYDSAPNFDKN